MKLLTDSPEGIKFKEFSNDTPYVCSFVLRWLCVPFPLKLVDWCNDEQKKGY